jgi:glycosyltransferase involved in cell wall biosynthesis
MNFIKNAAKYCIKKIFQKKKIRKLGICIPFYNGYDTIEKCLQSIFNGHHEFLKIDVIIVNDNTDQNAIHFLNKLSEKYQFRLYHNKQNIGLSQNWQKAIELTDADIVTLLHDDDYYSVGCLKRIFSEFSRDKKTIFVAVNAWVEENCDLKGRDKRPFNAKWQNDTKLNASLFIKKLFSGFAAAPSHVFLRKKALDKIDLKYKSQYKWCPELSLYFRLAKSNPHNNFIFIKERLLTRISSSNQFSKTNAHLRIEDYLTFLEEFKGFNDSDSEACFGSCRNLIFKLVKDIFIKIFNRDIEVMKMQIDLFNKFSKDSRLFHLIESTHSNREDFLNIISNLDRIPPNAPVFDFLTILDFLSNLSHGYRLRLRMAIDSNAIRVSQKLNPNKVINLDKNYYQNRNFIISSKYFNEPVIICGFHHSGTRLLAEILELIGVFQVTTSKTHEWAYFQWLNMGIIPDWNNADKIHNFTLDSSFPNCDLESLALRLSNEGYLGNSPWGFKDPRNTIALSYWLKSFPNSIVINIIRNPCDVLGTLPESYSQFSPLKRMPQEELEFWIPVYNAYCERIKYDLKLTKRCVTVKFENLCSEPVYTMQHIIDTVNLDCSVSENDIRQLKISSKKTSAHVDWLKTGKINEKQLDKIKKHACNYDTFAPPQKKHN